MAIKIQHTHYLDRVMRVFAFLLTFIVPFVPMYFIAISLQAAKIDFPNWLGWIVIIGLFIMVIMIRDGKLMNNGGPFDTFSAYLYIRLGLRIKISFAEARMVCNLFVPNYLGTWWPMKALKKTPKDYRRDEFFKLTRAILLQNPGLAVP